MSASDGTPHVFISYARADSEAVKRLTADLEKADIAVWVDRTDLTAGTADWEQALRDAIRAARAVLLAATPNSRKSPYVKDEIRIAQMYSRPIYPVWLDGEEWMDAIPVGMGGVQNIDARGERYNAAISEIVGVLRKTPLPLETAEIEIPPDF